MKMRGLERHEEVGVDIVQTSGGILLDRRGRMLLGLRAAHKRSSPLQWDIVGGHVEKGESLKDALIRELQEEIGITVRDCRLIASLRENPSRPAEPVHNVFAVLSWAGKPRNVSDEHVDIGWFTLRQVLSLPNRTPFDYAHLHSLACSYRLFR